MQLSDTEPPVQCSSECSSPTGLGGSSSVTPQTHRAACLSLPKYSLSALASLCCPRTLGVPPQRPMSLQAGSTGP